MLRWSWWLLKFPSRAFERAIRAVQSNGSMMTQPTETVSPSIYLIADHLDTMLAHGEDLLALVPPDHGEAAARELAHVQAKLALQRIFLEQVRAIETRLVTRVLRAREHAENIRRVDGRFKMITDLFVAGTHSVADAAADLVDSTSLDFTTGRDTIAYLRSRGLIADEATIPGRNLPLKISESFRLAGSIDLGALMDLASSYLDALELHYDLYGEHVVAKTEPLTAKDGADAPARVTP